MKRSPSQSEIASDAWLRAALLAAAAGTLGWAVHLVSGRLLLHQSAEPVYWLLATVILTMIGVLMPLPAVPRWLGMPIVSGVVFLCLASNIAKLSDTAIAELPSVRNFYDYSPFTICLGIMFLAVGAAFAASGALRHIMVALVLITFTILSAMTMQYQPQIDVLEFQHDSLAALARGDDPYAITFKDMYQSNHPWYGPGMIQNGVLQNGYPYMPLQLLLSVPGQIIGGDPRYANLAACVITAGLIAYSTSQTLSLLAALIFLTTPGSFYVIQHDWNEPFCAMLLAAVVFCAYRSPRLVPYVLGLFLVSKQYLPAAAALAILLVPQDGQSGRERMSAYWRMLAKAAIAAAIVTLPFILWNPQAFWKSAVMFHVHQPYRADALSFLAWYAGDQLKWPLLMGLGFVAIALAIAASLWRCRPTPAGFAAAVALCFLLFFAFGKEAFLNYYFFVVGALCCAVSALGATVQSSTS